MLTAIIVAEDDIEALGATLAALVPAVAYGVVRDAVVVDRSAGEDVRFVADAAGTAYAPARDAADSPATSWRRGAGMARGAWLFLLAAGDVPDRGWAHEAERFLMIAGPTGTRMPRAAQFRREGFSLKDRLARLARRWPSRSVIEPGLIVPRAVALRTGPPGRLRVEKLKGTIRRVAPRA
jgi:hypothetical protein